MSDYLEIIEKLPPVYPEAITSKIRSLFLNSGISIIVLDDDPTGTQTMYDVPVLTSWDIPAIELELKAATPVFFILTNSRSLSAKKADDLAREIGRNISTASVKAHRKVLVISRGDSTLRGHYPNEVNALGEGLGIGNAPHILIPAFFEGGRYTINDIHYVREGNHMVPAGETQFAKDSTFGYQSSDLKDYVEEKSAGRIKAHEVKSISLDDIRCAGPDRVAEILGHLKSGDVCIVNAAAQIDLDVFAAGFYKYMSGKKNVLFRTAASFIPSLSGLPLKKPYNLIYDSEGRGGVVAIGSYVPKTSKQLEYLINKLPLEYIEINVNKLLRPDLFQKEILKVARQINDSLAKDLVVVFYTSRQVVKGDNVTECLEIVNRVSQGVVEIVRNISIQPRFFIAKGGITSSDIATKGLDVKKAEVLGQLLPGVPVWQINNPCRFPGMMYIPFPGNLGEDDAVANAIQKLIS